MAETHVHKQSLSFAGWEAQGFSLVTGEYKQKPSTFGSESRRIGRCALKYPRKPWGPRTQTPASHSGKQRRKFCPSPHMLFQNVTKKNTVVHTKSAHITCHVADVAAIPVGTHQSHHDPQAGALVRCGGSASACAAMESFRLVSSAARARVLVAGAARGPHRPPTPWMARRSRWETFWRAGGRRLTAGCRAELASSG